MWVQNQMNVLVEIGEINRGTWGTKSQYYIPWSFDDEAHDECLRRKYLFFKLIATKAQF